jgi:hypothetical protein
LQTDLLCRLEASKWRAVRKGGQLNRRRGCAVMWVLKKKKKMDSV